MYIDDLVVVWFLVVLVWIEMKMLVLVVWVFCVCIGNGMNILVLWVRNVFRFGVVLICCVSLCVMVRVMFFLCLLVGLIVLGFCLL